MIHVVVGLGEVGKATSRVLARKNEVWGVDIDHAVDPQGARIETSAITERIAVDGGSVGVMHVALNAHAMGRERFVSVVQGYLRLFKPDLMDVLSTVWPGTTAAFGPRAVHSTTRGLHPNLERGILEVPKHVGGPRASVVAREFEACGVKCVTHRSATTTEACHILNNSHYGVNLMFADEAYRLCREWGVDYHAYMAYTETHNSGFRSLDHDRLVRPVLTPPNGRIGGHCVQQGATLIEKENRGWLLERLANYNGPEPVRDIAARLGVEPHNYLDHVSPEQIIGDRLPDSSTAERATDKGQDASSTPAPAPCNDDHTEIT